MTITATELTIVLPSLLTLIVLGLVLFWFWPEQRTDLFRQQMFAMRDELWDFAAADNVAFDDPAYVLLRQLMNGFIRYAHNLTPYRSFMSFLRWKYAPGEPKDVWTKSWNEALSKVSNENAQQALKAFHSRTVDAVMGQILLSPGFLAICAVLAPIIVLVIILQIQWTNFKAIYRDVTNRIPTSFIEEEAARA